MYMWKLKKILVLEQGFLLNQRFTTKMIIGNVDSNATKQMEQTEKIKLQEAASSNIVKTVKLQKDANAFQIKESLEMSLS